MRAGGDRSGGSGRGGRGDLRSKELAGVRPRPEGGGEMTLAKSRTISVGLAVAVAAICPRMLFPMGSTAARSSLPITRARSIAV
jgi:hypothetical protein